MPARTSSLQTRRETPPKNWLPLVSLAFTVLVLIGFFFAIAFVLDIG